MNYNRESMVIKFLPWYKIAASCLPACMLTIQSDCWNVIFLPVSLINMYSLFKVEVHQFFWKTIFHGSYTYIDMNIQIVIYMCMHTCPFLLWQLLSLCFSSSPKLPIFTRLFIFSLLSPSITSSSKLYKTWSFFARQCYSSACFLALNSHQHA